jgi:hypothetical protein
MFGKNNVQPSLLELFQSAAGVKIQMQTQHGSAPLLPPSVPFAALWVRASKFSPTIDKNTKVVKVEKYYVL